MTVKYDISNENGYLAGVRKELYDYNKFSTAKVDGSTDTDNWYGLNLIFAIYHENGQKYDLQFPQITPTTIQFYSSAGNLGITTAVAYQNNDNASGWSYEGILEKLANGTFKIIITRDSVANLVTFYVDNGYGVMTKIFETAVHTKTGVNIEDSPINRILLSGGCSTYNPVSVVSGKVARGTTDYNSLLAAMGTHKATLKNVSAAAAAVSVSGIDTTKDYKHGDPIAFTVAINEQYAPLVKYNGVVLGNGTPTAADGVNTYSYSVTAGDSSAFVVSSVAPGDDVAIPTLTGQTASNTSWLTNDTETLESYHNEMLIVRFKHNEAWTTTLSTQVTPTLLNYDMTAFSNAADAQKLVFDFGVKTNTTNTGGSFAAFRIYKDASTGNNFKVGAKYQLTGVTANSEVVDDINATAVNATDLAIAKNFTNGKFYIGVIRSGKEYKFYCNFGGSELKLIYTVTLPSDHATDTYITGLAFNRHGYGGNMNISGVGYKRSASYAYTESDLSAMLV